MEKDQVFFTRLLTELDVETSVTVGENGDAQLELMHVPSLTTIAVVTGDSVGDAILNLMVRMVDYTKQVKCRNSTRSSGPLTEL